MTLSWHQENELHKKDMQALGDPKFRAPCRRCGQIFNKFDMYCYDPGNVEWFLCAICGEDIDGNQEG